MKSAEINPIDDLQLRKIYDMVMEPLTEKQLLADCFDPNETDEQYFLRRKEYWENKNV